MFIVLKPNIMKKILLPIVVLIIACSSWQCKQKDTPQVNTSILSEENAELIKLKVIGLDDKVIADSIWRMIFTINGIDQISITQSDSTVAFRVDKNLVKANVLMQEVEHRGGKVVAN